ncbi:MAG TPA: formate acetyltransferase [Desulfobacteraceae bacterium]|nr:formate acetyltransferase [Desulfobacteraceae bacterium]
MASTAENEKQQLLEKGEYWNWAEKERSPRIDYLRKALWSKATKGSAYLPGVKVETEVIRWATKVFKEADPMEPWVLTKGKAMNATLTNIPIFIVDQAKVIGYNGSAPHMIQWIPWGSYMGNEDIFNDRADYIYEDDRPWLKEALDFWKPRTLLAKAEKYLTNKERMVSAMGYTLFGHRALSNLDYVTLQPEWMYKHGLEGIIKQIDENLASAHKKLHEGAPDGVEAFKILPKIDQWKAMKTSLEGILKWTKRHARLARIIAENFTADTKRKEELLRMAETCEKVPGRPPEHFWEVIQFDHFMSIAYRFEWGSPGAWPCRFDYYQWKYYKKDVIDEKKMTREEAVEYCAELRLRCYETHNICFRLARESTQGGIVYVWTLGGVDEDGNDACNDLTDCYLEAARLTRTCDPSISFRYHPEVRKETLKQVFECIKHGLGYPSMRNDPVLIKSLKHWFGFDTKDSRKWVHQACMAPAPVTKMAAPHRRYPGPITAAGCKSVELALFNGVDPVSKMRMGIKTGDAASFKTWEEFYAAWLNQHKQILYMGVRIDNIIQWVVGTQHQRPLISAMMERCVESGMDADAYAKEEATLWFTHFGFNEFGDALTGIKKLVYDDKKYTMEQLLVMLKANWVGYEKERMDFVKAPKWGNDDDYVDGIYVQGLKDLAKISWECKNPGGYPWPILPENIAAYVTGSSKVGALPNGRRHGDILYDGGCSPGPGLDKKGPTAVLRSVSKFDHVKDFRSNLLNQRLNPAQLNGEKGFGLWNNYMKSWSDLGINHVQFNMVDNETLIAAQKEPEDYPELLVRVAGYSAHFVELNRKTQDSMIARTVQSL